jgi:hypothetical protein
MGIGLVLFIVVLFALIGWFIVWYVKKANARYAQLWGGLAPLVAGAHKGSRMTGTYQGTPVQAVIRAVSGGENTRTTYYYECTATPGGQGGDWRAEYGGEKLFGFGEKRWHVNAKDDALKDRLAREGVLARMEGWAQSVSLRYKAGKGTLTIHYPTRDAFSIPSPEQFQTQLDLLAWAADVNRRVNQ